MSIIDDELGGKIEKARKSGKSIGLVQGSWDLFHLGHLRYILKARGLCDFLIIAMDSDKKIRKRKGNGRPVIPEEERYDFIKSLSIADGIVIKRVNEPKWGLIKELRPDVLIAIKENYSDKQIEQLGEFCGRVAILKRQSESSTSDKIRKITISSQKNKIDELDERVAMAVQDFKDRIDYDDEMEEPVPEMVEHLNESTDWICPVAVAYKQGGIWYFGTNQSDFNIPKYDVENRTELYYDTVEHAEVNLLKKIGEIEKLEAPFYATLLPCDKCMKVLVDKGVRKIYYLEDHPERNWSKRAHKRAEEAGVELICLLENKKK